MNESLGRSVAHFEDKDLRCPGDEAVGRRKLLKYKKGASKGGALHNTSKLKKTCTKKLYQVARVTEEGLGCIRLKER